MKRNTARHDKTRRLAIALDVPRYSAVGLLELLWHATAQLAPRGDIGKLSDEHIAEELYFDSNAYRLVESLVDAGWIDRCSEHRLVIHDWCDHADQTVRRTKPVQDQGFASAQLETSSELVSDEFPTSVPGTGNQKPGTGNHEPEAQSNGAVAPRCDLPLDAIASAFEAYGKPIRSWGTARLKALRARARESDSDSLASAVHGYAYLHRGSASETFDPLKHLTPETVFRASNFPKYLDAAHQALESGDSPPFDLTTPARRVSRGKGMDMLEEIHRRAQEDPWKIN